MPIKFGKIFAHRLLQSGATGVLANFLLIVTISPLTRNMKKLIPFLMATLALPVLGANYTAVPNWAKVPTGEKQIGNRHGDVAVSSKGEI